MRLASARVDSDRPMASEAAPGLKVVFDWDDVFWSSWEKVTDVLGVDREKWVDYHIAENELYTPTERKAILELLGAAETYQEMKLFPGLEEMHRLWDEIGGFFINSNCYAKEVAELKREQIRAALPMLGEERLRLNLVTPKAAKKPLDADTYILVDDNPYNIADSPAKINIVPRHPWNTTAKAGELMRGKDVRFVEREDLRALANAVRSALSG